MEQHLEVTGGLLGRYQLDPARVHVIGRSDIADIAIADTRVSREHGRVESHHGTWWFTNTSPSGTYDTNGISIGQVAITSSVEVRLGDPSGPALTLSIPGFVEQPSADSWWSGAATEAAVGPVAHLGASAAIEPATAATPVPSAQIASNGSAFTVGRSPDCDLVLTDVRASRLHAEIRATPDGNWEIHDLCSATGTWVHGVQVDSAVLTQGIDVTIGATPLIFDNGRLRHAGNYQRTVLRATGLSVKVPDGPIIMTDISLEAAAGTMTAVVGPSGAGKSTLLGVLTGQTPPTTGVVEVLGQDLYATYEQSRAHIGQVPQEDIVHAQLTVRECLTFGAELRFPEGLTSVERDVRIGEVLDGLGLTQHAEKQITALSGGQRKRVSVALELLTEPALLFLDEPTTGLDPGYELSTMELLRSLADDGRTVVVVTHSISSLAMCDQVVFLGPGGWVGFAGKAEDALGHFGVSDFPSIFRLLEGSTPPAQSTAAPSATTDVTDDTEPTYPNTFLHQLLILVRRQLAILVSDKRAALALMLGAAVPATLLALLISPGSLEAGASAGPDARRLIGAMVVTIGVLGAANGIREIVKETPIYRRERTTGLRRSSYLLSKLLLFAAITAIQAGIVVGIATARAGGPGAGNLLPGRIELIGDLALTGIATMTIGLLISAIVTSSEKAVAMIPVMFVLLWLFSGTVVDLGEKPVIREIAMLSPSSWGMGAAASTSDLLNLESCGSIDSSDFPTGSSSSPSTAGTSCDAKWNRGFVPWMIDLVMLFVMAVASLLAADIALARKESLEYMRRQHFVGTSTRSAATRWQEFRDSRAP